MVVADLDRDTAPAARDGQAVDRPWHRAELEDNRWGVDSLSAGRLAYVWVPNTGGQGVVSFNRYFFAQQDRQGAVIDERFNGGGNLDDYMVDYMTRSLRAAITNEVPRGNPLRLPAGVQGPKVLLINEMAGSGGDYFPFAFRQQQAGPLIGARTWGGLLKLSVHYALVDGGSVAAGRDPQLERGVQEALRLLEAQGARRVTPPPFSRPSRRPR